MLVKSPETVIFIHYGKATYLRRNLCAARRTNPSENLFLLGDETNRDCAKGIADFVDYRSLENEKTAAFDQVFRPLEGQRHKYNKLGGTKVWLNFVFRRWFLIAEFLRKENIQSFWTFDSDTLLLAPLQMRRRRFLNMDATTQCRDCCLNGFVGSRRLVDAYIQCVLDLFRDPDYLEAQRARLKKQAGLAFNEMDAFCEFRRRSRAKTFHAALPSNGEFFDDALAFDEEFEESSAKVAGRITVKRLWSSPDGALYARHFKSGNLVRMVTCNLSWLPDYVGKKLMRFCLSPQQDAKVKSPKATELREVDISQPVADKIATVLMREFYKLKMAFGR